MPASSKLPEPRKKKRIHQPECSPLPVPISSIEGKAASISHWYYYSGQLVGNSVLVAKPGDITFLYKMGFFGKGMLSRSKPEHKRFISSYQGVVRKRLPPKERRFQQQRFQQVRKQRYMRHLKWFSQFKEQQKELSDSQESRQESKCDDGSSESVHGEQQSSADVNKTGNACTSNDGEPDLKRAKFDDIAEDNLSCITQSDDVTQRSDDVTAETDVIRTGNACTSNDGEPGLKSAKCDDIAKNSLSCITQSDDVSQRSDDVTAGTDDAIRTGYANTNRIVIGSENNSPVDFSINRVCVASEVDILNADAKMDSTSQEISSKFENVCTADCTENYDIEMENTKVNDEDNTSESTDVVIADSDDSDDGEVGMVTSDQKELKEYVQETVISGSKHGKKKVMKKKDPYPIQEYLELSLEEAYFLAFGLGCLTVKDEDGNSMNLTSMWQKFCCIQPNFVSMYVVYHNIRSKGWVPKTGIKFGSDFIVYKQGPPFYHSTYSVLVSMVDEATLLPCGQEERPLSWPVVSGMNRVTEHAAKALLFCYVLKPPNMADQEMLSPQCLTRFKVQEILMQRWIPSRERQDKPPCPMIS